MNRTPPVRQYGIPNSKWGVNYVKRESQRYKPEFKKQAAERLRSKVDLKGVSSMSFISYASLNIRLVSPPYAR